ncbi:DNA polymerase-4 [Psychrobacillus psychrotolerans]|uniref:DNA polymerase IV n=1 Tax=Psychrobacillus psychrotolerans TaxID=126156 RepID=A0A1I5UZQ0_9BACI|nr:DNA polymerase IV [Psychrobacillus psychrotolerans]SFQ00764.1 DNA polymerase-4 [Psychrobacillus psychrotolerans]
MSGKHRIIFHLDMNSFYASVEQAHDPSLKGKAIAIAGNPKERRGILVTCSYEARAKGVYTTMSVWEAKRKCPELILLPPNFEIYRIASKAMFEILRSYTHLVEPVSIDEGYMDVTELDMNNDAIGFAKSIQDRILRELDLPSSIGIAPNKFLAKTASNIKKPMGITVLRKRQVNEILWPLPVIDMHGIGESTARKLESIGIKSIGDLANANPNLLKEKLGKNGVRLLNRANGIDNRAVDPESIYDTKSVGNSTTLPYDESNIEELEKVFVRLSKKVAARLDAKNLAGRSITIHIRDANWKNKTKSKTLTSRLYKEQEIYQLALELFNASWNGDPIRLLGVTVNNVYDKGESVEQLSIFNFEEHAKEEPILKLVEQLQGKFGEDSIKRGMKVKKKPSLESKTSFSKDFLDDHND